MPNTNVFVAMEAVGRIMSTDPDVALEAAADIAAGNQDEGIVELYESMGKDTETAKEGLKTIKQMCRAGIEEALKVAYEFEVIKRNENFYQLQSGHDSGLTTAQLADKLGVSKKAVRKMKAAGTLDAELANLETENG